MTEIVTYLEMTSPDELVEATAVPGVRLERAEAGSPLIRELLVRVGRPHQWRTLSWSEERWAEYLNDPLRQVWFVTHDDEAGPQYAGITSYLPNETADGGEEVQISHFGLVPEYVGRGLGGHALTLTIQTAWTLNPSTNRVWLHTSTLDHPNALPNYQKRGFRPYAKKVRKD
ncbi:MAG TPA: GNAT family N-acetyltransferase [Kribbella sp.]|uniref:GNAT family N-acetyltransferase n=1 Tax=Kribbella sp. TaxID=1871183 RepID=UPI002D782CA0|nr:GNAT family N-acetyltransferase [Kribbella sp.]HET6293555.1 GNAT family N-acetyltransferase [Kribbella sp.]